MNSSISNNLNEKRIHEIVDVFRFDDERVKLVMDVFEREMELGLRKNEADRKKSSLLMENTFVRETVNGTENGDYLALDLGGTNFRVLYVNIRDGKVVNPENVPCKTYVIPEYILCGTVTTLFDYLAESIYRFVKANGIKMGPTAKVPLGFTFSFPMIQKKLNSGFLVTWTKSFKIQGGVMEDAVLLLEEAIERRGDLSVHIVAVLSDTTGTLMAGAYYDHRAEIGLIMGTGSNCCYMEHLERIEKWQGEINEPKQVIINIEWGAFGDNGVLSSIKTKYDRLVDLKSNHTGSFTFEKYFSGLYMGELVRLVLTELCTEKLIFNGQGSEKLFTHMALQTKHISMALEGSEDCLDGCSKVVNELELESVSTDDDLRVLRYVCDAVSTRAARLVGSCLAVLVKHVNKPEVAIAADGSVIKFHPTLRPMMEHHIAELCPNTEVSFVLADDGSGKGAAFVAAVAVRMEREGLANSAIVHTEMSGEALEHAANMGFGNAMNGHSVENLTLSNNIQLEVPTKTMAATSASPGIISKETGNPFLNGKHFVHS